MSIRHEESRHEQHSIQRAHKGPPATVKVRVTMTMRVRKKNSLYKKKKIVNTRMKYIQALIQAKLMLIVVYPRNYWLSPTSFFT